MIQTLSQLPDPDLRRMGQLAAFLKDDITIDAVETAARECGLQPTIIRGGVVEAARKLARSSSPRILVVDLGSSEMMLSEVEDLANVCDPGVHLIAIGDRNDVGIYRELIAKGVVDYLVKPISSGLVKASLARATDENPRTAGKAARLITVTGARGGVGASLIAASIAWMLAEERRRRTMLIDLDLSFGTAPLGFDVEPARGLREAIEEPERADGLIIERSATRVSDRLSMMAAEGDLLPLPGEPVGLQTLLDETRKHHHFVVADVPHAVSTICMLSLQQSDDALLVTDLSVAGLRDTLRLATAISTLNSACEIRIVANLVGQHRRGEVAPKEFEAALGRRISCRVPFDGRHVLAALNLGRPVPSESRAVASALDCLLDQLCATTTARGARASRLLSWLGR